MKNSGLADSPFFEKQHPAAARNDALSTRREAADVEVQEYGVQADQTSGMTASRQDGRPSAFPDDLVEMLRSLVKESGKERSEHRLSMKEKEAIVDIIYQSRRQGIRTTENEVARIAMNFIIADYRQNGEKSLLARVLVALNS